MAIPNESIKTKWKIAKRRHAGDVRQNDNSTGEGIVSNNIGLSFVYLMCLSFCIFVLFFFLFYPSIFRIVSCITCIYFWKHTQAFRFGGVLAICPMTIDQGSDAWKLNSYLSACLVMVGIRTLTISCNASILSLRRSSLDKYETHLRPDRKPTHVHIMNRTCP